MNCVEEIIEQVVSGFENSPYLSDCRIVRSFSGAIKDSPLRQATIAVGIGALSLNEGAAGRYFGMGADGAGVFGRVGRFEIKLTAAVPKSLGGEKCDELLSAICSAAVDGSPAGRVISLKAGEISVQRELGALVITAIMTLDAIIGSGGEEGEMFENIVVKSETGV